MLLSCHSCDSTADMSLRSADYFIANLQRWMSGQSLQHVVDKTRGY
jgi:phosphoglycerate dehydrogenase-like enzyme